MVRGMFFARHGGVEAALCQAHHLGPDPDPPLVEYADGVLVALANLPQHVRRGHDDIVLVTISAGFSARDLQLGVLSARTSVTEHVAEARMPSLSSFLPTESPAASPSTTKQVMPL
jgi:hypothetical protein